jgi:hypothetical protein
MPRKERNRRASPCCVTILGDRPTIAFVAFLAWLARRHQRRIAQVVLPPLNKESAGIPALSFTVSDF